MLLCQLPEVACLLQRHGKWLIKHDVLAGAQCGRSQGKVAVIGTRDHDQINIGMHGQIVRTTDGGAGQFRLNEIRSARSNLC